MILFDRDTIAESISEIAEQINKYYEYISEPLMIVPVLNGGIFFYVDLVRQLTFPNEMGVISTSHYPNGKEVRDLEIKFLDAVVEGREVMLVDEICYTGKTLLELQHLLLSKGAIDVTTAVLLNQPKEHENIIHIPKWAALEHIGKEWVFGQGMDLKGLHRNKLDIEY